MKKIIFIISMLFTLKTAIPQNITWIEKDGPWKPNVTDISIGENLMIPDLKAIYVATGYGLFKSTDGGGNWIKLFNESLSAVECLRDNPNIVYVAKQNIGLFKSTNGGSNFVSINTGINNN